MGDKNPGSPFFGIGAFFAFAFFFFAAWFDVDVDVDDAGAARGAAVGTTGGAAATGRETFEDDGAEGDFEDRLPGLAPLRRFFFSPSMPLICFIIIFVVG